MVIASLPRFPVRLPRDRGFIVLADLQGQAQRPAAAGGAGVLVNTRQHATEP